MEKVEAPIYPDAVLKQRRLRLAGRIGDAHGQCWSSRCGGSGVGSKRQLEGTTRLMGKVLALGWRKVSTYGRDWGLDVNGQHGSRRRRRIIEG